MLKPARFVDPGGRFYQESGFPGVPKIFHFVRNSRSPNACDLGEKVNLTPKSPIFHRYSEGNATLLCLVANLPGKAHPFTGSRLITALTRTWPTDSLSCAQKQGWHRIRGVSARLGSAMVTPNSIFAEESVGTPIGQQPVVLLFNNPITFTDPRFQPRPVQDNDFPAAVVNQSCSLQLAS